MILPEPREPRLALMVPDMPSAMEILPWMERIDASRTYSNFGPLVRELEERLAAITPARAPTREIHAAAVGTGTAAIELALMALGIGAGHRVMLPSFTFPATATAVRRVGAQVVFVDVDEATWSLTPEIALEALERMPVDLVLPVAAFGRPVEIGAWDAFSETTGIPVVVDAAAAFGTQAVGSRTVVACSLHATKPFGIGEGGVVLAAQPELVARVRTLANFGFEGGIIRSAGCNGKLSEYHAAVGLAQVERFGAVQGRRRRTWERYERWLRNMPEGITVQEDAGDAIRAAFPVRIEVPGGAATVVRRLTEARVQTRRWYHPALHDHPAFVDARRLGPDGSAVLPVTAALGQQIVGIPFHSFLSDTEIASVCAIVREALLEARVSEPLLRRVRHHRYGRRRVA